MASTKNSDHENNHQVREIHPDELERLHVVGEGSFGVVFRARWKVENKDVAVKNITNDKEKKTFLFEVRQLSRISHDNIVQLYGAYTQGTQFFLVMEFAEGGSLHNLLHKSQLEYNMGHAMSWAYQCAKGVKYLHAMTPRPLVHRDLKPLNLLLINEYRHLKICDFGTAADLKTVMSNNKGSAAWMAPEVFQSDHYGEKCDIFSWGIILWEVLSRKRPFHVKDINPFQIMWSIHLGKRPPLLQNCPPVIENLMTRSWDQDSNKRPSMAEIVKIMEVICSLTPGADEPIQEGDEIICEEEDQSIEDTLEDTEENNSGDIYGGLDNLTINPINGDNTIRTLPQPSEDMMRPLPLDIGQGWPEYSTEYDIRTMPGLDISIPRKCTQDTVKAGISSSTTSTNPDLDDFSVLVESLDPDLRPATPDFNDPRSVEKYEENKMLVEEYLKLQSDLVLLEAKKKMLLAKQAEDEERRRNIRHQQTEKENLRCIRDLLEQPREITPDPHSGEEWFMVPRSERTE